MNTADRITFKRHAYDWQTKGKRLLSIIKADFPGRAASSAITAPLLGFSPVTFVVNGVVVAAIKDSDFMANRGGFRCYVNETDIDTPKDHDAALFVMEMGSSPNNPVTLDGLQTGSGGDGTVPVSSATALPALALLRQQVQGTDTLRAAHERHAHGLAEVTGLAFPGAARTQGLEPAIGRHGMQRRTVAVERFQQGVERTVERDRIRVRGQQCLAGVPQTARRRTAVGATRNVSRRTRVPLAFAGAVRDGAAERLVTRHGAGERGYRGPS